MPMLEAYLKNLKKLTALDSLRAVSEIAVGSGTVSPEKQKELLSSWEEDADLPKRKIRISKEGPEFLGAMGINVEVRR